MRLPFYSGHFPATHVHVERSDWLDSVKATSSGRFCYLSARRSRLASLLRNHSSTTVSILTTYPAWLGIHTFSGILSLISVIWVCSIRRPNTRHSNPCGRRRFRSAPLTHFFLCFVVLLDTSESGL